MQYRDHLVDISRTTLGQTPHAIVLGCIDSRKPAEVIFNKGLGVHFNLIEALITIHQFTRLESHKNAVIKHAEMVFSSGKQNFEDKNDINDLTERAVKILNK